MVCANAALTSGLLTAKETVVKHPSRRAGPATSTLPAIPIIVAEDQLFPRQ